MLVYEHKGIRATILAHYESLATTLVPRLWRKNGSGNCSSVPECWHIVVILI